MDYTFSGEFTPVGWSGTYKYRLYIESLNATCTYTTNYSGDKLGKINKKSNKHHNFEDILLRRIISSWNVNAN
ncbi:MAG: hypothetical protein GY936_16625 [Ignavibacteriae bacterium]|nr:hypothetical protein [Ignavibacteriota bacterium]